jgi:hypothetical protein
MGAGALSERKLFADKPSPASINKGDVAILRLLAAAEIIEADLWQQYAELGGVNARPTKQLPAALQFLDGDASQYITSNTLDEGSHAAFINAYLESKGEEPVNFDQFRTLPSSQATGAKDKGDGPHVLIFRLSPTHIGPS